MEQSSSSAANYPGGNQTSSTGGGQASPVRDALKEGRQGISDAASSAAASARGDMESLRNDLNSLTQTVREFMANASSEATKAGRSAAGALMEQAGTVASETGSKIASAVSGQAKTFASELEEMGRRHPLGAMAGAVVVGMLIGLMSRGRH